MRRLPKSETKWSIRWLSVLKSNYGNASSTHGFGRSSKSIIESCRKRIASHFNASASEIVFTSGGTEADNLVLKSAVKDLNVTHIITSKIEHHAVLHTVEQLAMDHKIKVSYVTILSDGTIDYNHLRNAFRIYRKNIGIVDAYQQRNRYYFKPSKSSGFMHFKRCTFS